MRCPTLARSALTLQLVLGALLIGCSDDAAVQPPAPARPPATGPKFSVPAEEAGEATDVAYRYDPTDKRDPFRSFIRETKTTGPDDPLARFDLSQLSVTGIIWGTEGPRALIKDPAGKGYIVIVGTVVGKNQGRIIAIDDNVVRVKETYVDALNRATTKNVEMRLREAHGG